MQTPGADWLVEQLQLTNDELVALTTAEQHPTWSLDTAVLTVQTIARRVVPGALPRIVRRPLPALGGRSVFDLILADPHAALAFVEHQLDWSGTA